MCVFPHDNKLTTEVGRGMIIINISKFIECLKMFTLNNYVRIFEINYPFED